MEAANEAESEDKETNSLLEPEFQPSEIYVGLNLQQLR